MAQAVNKKRAELVQHLTRYIQSAGRAWVTSSPINPDLRFEAAPSVAKQLCDELHAKGFKVEATGTSKRLVPDGIVETISRLSSEGGATMQLRHAGLIDVEQFSIRI